uniref:hypothetical protein n=1 Tax=Sphingomicrobium astaxanthinifaciens TaxID=1227949 RepID=UPI0022404BDB
NIEFGSRKEVDAAFIDIVQVQGNKPASLWIKLFDGANDGVVTDNQSRDFANNLGSGTVVEIGMIRIIKGDGIADVIINNPANQAKGVLVTGIEAGDRIEFHSMNGAAFDQVLALGETGKFDIGAFGTLEPPPIPDKILDFTASVTDGDMDSAIASWSVGIDGTGAFNDDIVIFPAPLALSLADDEDPAPEMHIIGENWISEDLYLA